MQPSIPPRGSSLQAPEIHERFSSVVSPTEKSTIENLRKRKLNHISSMPDLASSDDFITTKINIIDTDLELARMHEAILLKAYQKNILNKAQYNDALNEISSERIRTQNQVVILKKERRTIPEDLDMEKTRNSIIEDAYESLLVQKIEAASAKQERKKAFNQSKFRDCVMKYYESTKVEDDQKLAFCHLTGWWPDDSPKTKQVKAAHLVAKSLSGDDLSYLFGVNDALLYDARNSLSLYHTIEEKMDCGELVIVPVLREGKLREGTEPIWKMVLTDKSLLKKTVYATCRWKELDGKELTFLGSARPARRFMYFRFILTYLMCQRKGKDMSWVKEVRCKGQLWTTPEPYLRKSMLINLARRISDKWGASTFQEDVKTTTFEDAPLQRARPQDEEDMLAESLVSKVEEMGVEKGVEAMEDSEVDE